VTRALASNRERKEGINIVRRGTTFPLKRADFKYDAMDTLSTQRMSVPCEITRAIPNITHGGRDNIVCSVCKYLSKSLPSFSIDMAKKGYQL